VAGLRPLQEQPRRAAQCDLLREAIARYLAAERRAVKRKGK
jgi:hypothetical protein